MLELNNQNKQIAVIGIGNILMSDDGAGIFALRELEDRFDWPDYVELIDGGTKGLELLPFVEDKERILFIDAVNFGMEAGHVGELSKEEIPDYFVTKLSVHQIALPDLIGAGRLLGTLTEEIHLVGIQPAYIETGYGLTDPLINNFESFLSLIVKRLNDWGIRPSQRNLPRKGTDNVPCNPFKDSQ
jgi:hydrogenase maturation protease